jgi:uncharacterized tellurite resistance protein B-like protein
MPKPRVIMALAKVLIAAAWTDGTITNEEVNSLKDLLFHLPGMTAHDWSELDIYLDAPVEPDERARLVTELQEALTERSDREMAVAALEGLIQADGQVSDEERAVFQEVRSALEAGNAKTFGHFGRMIRGPVQRRSEAVESAPNRELYLDDFVNNRIYYQLSHRWKKDLAELDLPEVTLRKLSLAGGLMARVANVDRQVTAEEFESMVVAVQRYLDLEREAAGYVAEVAVSAMSKDLDYYRLSRIFQATSEEERVRFLDVLFAVAAADGILSHEEMDDIRQVAIELNNP